MSCLHRVLLLRAKDAPVLSVCVITIIESIIFLPEWAGHVPASRLVFICVMIRCELIITTTLSSGWHHPWCVCPPQLILLLLFAWRRTVSKRAKQKGKKKKTSVFLYTLCVSKWKSDKMQQCSAASGEQWLVATTGISACRQSRPESSCQGKIESKFMVQNEK